MATPDKSERIPVLIGVGEICDRPGTDADGLDSIQLMRAALQAAERDVGVRVLDRLEWLGVEDQISFPMAATHEALAATLAHRPARLAKTFEATGDGPLQLINDAANLIGRGDIRLGAAVGGEALRTAARRAQADIAAGREPPKRPVAETTARLASPLARRYGLLTPIDVYPLYENATRSAWGQTLSEAQQESGEIWLRFSEVAAENPFAWMRTAVTAEQIINATIDNRMVSFPYTKLMVANASVNMGAAVIVASLAMARELGIREDRMVYIAPGAAAHESDDVLLRDSYAHLASLETTIAAALDRSALGAADLDHVELYSCFPCIPKLARRVLGWPVERPASVYGGLTFGGGPIGNCMMHAVARMVVKLREGGVHGLIVANGGYATHSHSMVLTRRPVAAGAFPQDYSVQAEASLRQGPAPTVIEDYTGDGTIETFTIPFDRTGTPRFGTVIARTPQGARFLAHVPGEDRDTLAWLMDDVSPIGAPGRAERVGEGVVWRR